MARFYYDVATAYGEHSFSFTSAKSAESYAKRMCEMYHLPFFISRYSQSGDMETDQNYYVWYEWVGYLGICAYAQRCQS